MKILPTSILSGLKKSLEMDYSPLGSTFAMKTRLHHRSGSPRFNDDDSFWVPPLY